MNNNPPAKKKNRFQMSDIPKQMMKTEKGIFSGIGKAAKAVYKGTVGNALDVEKNHAKVNGIDYKTGKKLPQYKKGGKVKKTGPAVVHKGERVLTKAQAKQFDAKKFERARRSHFRLGKKP